MFNYEIIQTTLALAPVLYAKDNHPYPVCNSDEISKVYDCCIRATKLAYVDTKEEQVSLLIYNLVKNHYLKDANKRLTVSMFILFSCIAKSDHELLINNFSNLDLKQIKELMISIAASKSEEQDLVLAQIKAFVLKVWGDK